MNNSLGNKSVHEPGEKRGENTGIRMLIRMKGVFQLFSFARVKKNKIKSQL